MPQHPPLMDAAMYYPIAGHPEDRQAECVAFLHWNRLDMAPFIPTVPGTDRYVSELR